MKPHKQHTQQNAQHPRAHGWLAGIIATATLSLIGLGFLGTATAARAQSSSWAVKDGYLAFDGKPMFLSGANYIPSRDWYMILKNWDSATVAADMKAMHDIGVRIVRFPPLWPILQDDDGKIIEKNLDHLDEMLRIAHRNGIHVQVEFFTGGVDGATMLPKWAEGNIFVDPKIIQREQELVTAVVNRLKDNPGLFSYDFGNEINILYNRLEKGAKVKVTPGQMRDWMLLITKTAHDADPHSLVAPGLAAVRSRDGLFNIWDIADATDYTSIHSWAYFDQTIKSDPWIGQRTLYNMNYGIAYNAMAGKPVMVQETGFAEWWIGSKKEVAKALRISLVSAWAQGAAAFLWWGSHDTRLDYRIPVENNATFSEANVRNSGIMNNLEYSEGLIDSENQPKVYGLEFKRWSDIIEKLGVGWKETLPIVYVLQPDDKSRGFPDRIQRTAFTLAKQAHMDVKLWPEWKPIPADAAAVVIAGFGLTEKGKAHVGQFLKNGGLVYQSWVNDFAKNVVVTDAETTLTSPEFLVAFPRDSVPMRNTLPFNDGEYLRVNAKNLKVRNIASVSGPETRVLLRMSQDKEQTDDVDITTDSVKAVVPKAKGKAKGNAPAAKNQPVYTETKVGKGTYYYFAGNLEETLAATYNPWANDNSDKIYGAVRPPAPVDIDSKLVELYVKERGNEKLLVLLNRSNAYQHVTVSSNQSIKLHNYETRAPLGAGREISVGLSPGEVLIAQMADMTDN